MACTGSHGLRSHEQYADLGYDDSVQYEQCVVAAGLTLNWGAVEGLAENLGKNGVTSNYRYDTAPYTWDLVKSLKAGRAIFTQPPMPIKCAGAPRRPCTYRPTIGARRAD